GTYQLSIPRTTTDATTGDLDITRTVDVVGAGRESTIVDGGALDSVFHVQGSNELPGIRVRFKHMTIRNGRSANYGGAINIDIGYARVHVLDCALVNNVALVDGGGISTYGYTLTVIGSLIEGNSAGRGGGIAHFYNYAQAGMIRRSVIRNNTAVSNGAGLLNFGNMRIEDSLIDGNTATGGGSGGGGLSTANLVTTVLNTTFTGNSAASGGAFQTVGSSASFTNVTVTANLDDNGGDGFYFSVAAPATITNSVFADNVCATAGPGVPLPVTSGGGNVEASNTCGFGGGPGDRVNVPDAGVDALADNGGDSQTHALLAGSPAVGAAVQAKCPFVDQRGFIRDDGDCDSGAFERGASVQACAASPEELTANLGIGVSGQSFEPVGAIEVCLQALAGYP
ncbi:MAG: hypothetical protein KC466_13105, partial [Myxococcales bacterium]|nr:hypothetical protein [Myxococcales bacterium]